MTNLFALFDKIGHTGPVVPAGPPTCLVVGLGNPGADYDNTRHNTGFRCLDAIAETAGVRPVNLKFSALTAEAVIGGKKVLLMKPQTYMNLSGEAVRAAADFYRIAPSHIYIICDDVNFDVGHVRIRLRGSNGGHNGLKSIEVCLASSEYPRIRVGVGKKPNPAYDLADWVLGKFPTAEKEALASVTQNVCSAITLLLSDKPDEAMSRYST